jgi:hypothetical protein
VDAPVGPDYPSQKEIVVIYEPYPDLTQILTMVGAAGRRLSEIEASEGAAGNMGCR